MRWYDAHGQAPTVPHTPHRSARCPRLSNTQIILQYCIMRPFHMKFDFLHCALLAIVVLLAVYGFGSGVFREGLPSVADACDECATNCFLGPHATTQQLPACLDSCWSTPPATSSPAQTKCRKACTSSHAATKICKGNGHW